jgi:hypothetical protein
MEGGRVAIQETSEEELLARAKDAGYTLDSSEADTGNILWMWRREGEETGPCFLARREAFYWIYEWLQRNGIYR